MSIDASKGTYRGVILATPTANRIYVLPDMSGTIALSGVPLAVPVWLSTLPPESQLPVSNGTLFKLLGGREASSETIAAVPTPTINFQTVIKPQVVGMAANYLFQSKRLGSSTPGDGDLVTDLWGILAVMDNYSTADYYNNQSIGIGSYARNAGGTGVVYGALFLAQNDSPGATAHALELDVVNVSGATATDYGPLGAVGSPGGTTGLNIAGFASGAGSAQNSLAMFVQAGTGAEFRKGILFSAHTITEHAIDFNLVEPAVPPIRLANTAYIVGRNAANAADVNLIGVNAANQANIPQAALFGSTVRVTGAVTIDTSLLPDANDGAVLGAAGTAFSDLFLAEGAVINWDSGDATLTQTGDSLALAGADLTVPNETITGALTLHGGVSTAWAAYTPTFSGAVTAIGNATMTARWAQIGKIVHVYVQVQFGTTTTFGAGNMTVSLPVTSAATPGEPVGVAQLGDTGVTNNTAIVVHASTTTVLFRVTVAGAALVSNTVPHTWGNTDQLLFTATYEAA